MKTDYLIQPRVQIGDQFTSLIQTGPLPTLVIAVSAFASRQTLMRLRKPIADLLSKGVPVRFVVGIDLDGTSEEALKEILGWGIDARIMKNKRPFHTFHPKLYLVERPHRADLIIGSSNITEGGFYRNYECSVHITYVFPEDSAIYEAAMETLRLFLDPSGRTVRTLTRKLISLLKQQGLIRDAREIQRDRRRIESRNARRAVRSGAAAPIFGPEHIPDPPALPASLLSELIEEVRRERKSRRRRIGTGLKLVIKSPVEISPTSFYMHLTKLQGPSIPGEARIPLAARDLAEEFWGWPGSYRKEYGSTGRVYWNWKPTWHVSDASAVDQIQSEEVRMYEYADSSDFRFYSSKLVQLGADKGDIVRIRRLGGPDAEFECVMAKAGTPTHARWVKYCTEQIRNSPGRKFGYA